MRSLSLTLTEAMNAQESGETPIALLTFEHPDFPGPLRLSSDPTTRLSENPLQYGTVSDSETYLFCPMSIQLPDDMDERAPNARLAIENVSRELVAFIRSVTTPGTCRIVVVLASAPDTVEVEWPILDVKGVQYNANILTVELGLDALETEPFPSGAFVSSYFPGLFG